MRDDSSARRSLRFVAAGALLTLLAAGCSERDPSATGGGGQAGAGENAGGTSNAGSGNANTGGSFGLEGGSPSGSGGKPACGIGTAEASLRPVTMLVMFDRSTSMIGAETVDPMTGLDRWQTASLALEGFFSDPATEGLGVALRFFPDARPVAGCEAPKCDADACSRPMVEASQLTAAAAPADAHEQALLDAIADATPTGTLGSGTPTSAALGGAARWAKDYAAEHRAERTIILFVTDGQPAGCEEDVDTIAQGVADALASDQIATYFVGLTDDSALQDTLDTLARAGGTEEAYFVQDGPSATSDLLDTMRRVRGQAIECDFALPEATSSGRRVDPRLVNVTYTSRDEANTEFTKVLTPSSCDDSASWYYDDEEQPTRVHLCPAACELVSADPGARLRIEVGCLSIVK